VPSVLVYCQSGYGVGHLVRVSRLINAIRERNVGIEITVVYGGPPAPWIFVDPSIRLVQLEPLWFNDSMSRLVSSESEPDAVLRRRRDVILKSLKSLQPALVILEHFPFGRWAHRTELLPLIDACKSQKPKPEIWVSVRDIVLISEKHATAVDQVLSQVDRVFVHSDPAIQPFVPGELRLNGFSEKLEYTGYVTPPVTRKSNRQKYVVVHAGGGRDGAPLWLAVDELEKRNKSLTFVRCGQFPGQQKSQRELLNLIGDAGCCISMAGYNSVAEWLKLQTPTIFVPRTSDSEQPARLERLAARVGGPMCSAAATVDDLSNALRWLTQEAAPLRQKPWIDGQNYFARQVCEELN